MSKRSPREIVETIFSALENADHGFTIGELAKRTHSNWSTINSYLDLIEYIQTKPKLTLIRTERYKVAQLQEG